MQLGGIVTQVSGLKEARILHHTYTSYIICRPGTLEWQIREAASEPEGTPALTRKCFSKPLRKYLPGMRAVAEIVVLGFWNSHRSHVSTTDNVSESYFQHHRFLNFVQCHWMTRRPQNSCSKDIHMFMDLAISFRRCQTNAATTINMPLPFT